MSTPTQPLPGRADGPVAHVEIRRFVAAVERALDDLPVDDVAELVGGLEADLSEAWVAEGTSPAQRFGSPEAYAGELRAAAGLPPRAMRVTGRQGIPAAVRSVAVHVRLAVTRIPGWPKVHDLALTLRPVWWVARGYAAYSVAVFFLTRYGLHPWPDSLPLKVALVLAVLVSVELGRRMAGWSNVWLRGVVLAGDVAAIGVLIGVANVANNTVYDYYPVEVQTSQNGLYNGDYKVVNVFPYDQDGKPLTGVQLFDDRGRPLDIGSDGRGYLDRESRYLQLVPGIGKDGQQRWNVFPMRELPQPEVGVTGDARPAPRTATLPDPTQGPLIVTADPNVPGEK